MAVVTGPVYVPAPNPVVRRYGLFDAATGPLDLPQFARGGGLNYQVGTCQLPVGYEVNCQASHASKSFDGTITTIVGYPFVVYSSVNCSPVGLANFGQDRVRQFLYQQLVAGEQATVERIFSQSTFGVTNGLSGNPAVVNLGAASDIVDAVSDLESWLYARYGLPGVLHIPIKGAGYMHQAMQIEGDSVPPTWTTAIGTKVSFGNYAGLGPTGQDPTAGNTWIYITGQVAVYRTPDSDLPDIPIGQVLNRATNVVDIIMEREYVITYDCYVAGIQVPLNPV